MVPFWIYLCALLNCAGWVLSALHQLNVFGYTVFLIVGGVVGWMGRQTFGFEFRFGKLRPRLKRWRTKLFPLTFLLLASLAILGGVLHPPANYDALAYRIPRVLHWLAAEQWHWIHTDFPRMNTRICGIEWVSAPMILFLKTDRLLFLINAVSFLLLPGLSFSLLRHLGVSARVAWHWMWLLPGGYGYLLQAGSISNDMFGAVFVLAAIDYAFRAHRQRKLAAGLISVLSAALITSAKSSNLPLLLPWLIALLPAWRLFVARPVVTLAVALFAAVASFLPTALMNVKQCGDWTGLKVESANFQGSRPFLHIGANTGLLAIQNLAPPIFPLAAKWNRTMDALLPETLVQTLETRFERVGAHFSLGEMQMEEGAGLGCGLTLLVLATAIWRWRHANSHQSLATRWLNVPGLVVAGSWIAALVFMASSGLGPAARYLVPHYILLAAPFLTGTTGNQLVRKIWWRSLAMFGVLLAVALIVVTPPRPLWPATTILRAAGAERSSHPLVRRAWAVYSVYGERADAFAPARREIAPEINPLGMVTFDDPETSMWRPFGTRRIVHVTRSDTAIDLQRRGIHYVLVSSTVLAVHHNTTLAEFLQKIDGAVVQTWNLALRAESGPREWYLVKLRGAAPDVSREDRQ